MKLFCTLLSFFLFLVSHGQYVSRGESRESLYLQLFRNNTYLGSATGFVIKSPTRHYLVTNYHVVTHKNPATKKWVNAHHVMPNKVAIFHNALEEGKYFVKFEKLYTTKGKKRWIENLVKIREKKKIKYVLLDAAELPLSDTAGVRWLPVDYSDSVEYGYKKDSIVVESFPLALKTAYPSPVHSAGLLDAHIDVDPTGKYLVWLSEKEMAEMSGSPLFIFRNSANESEETNASAQKQLAGVFVKMPGIALTFVRSSILRSHLSRLP